MNSQQKSPEEQLQILKSGVVDLIGEKELLDKLKEGRPLKIKAGFDPSRPDLHLGHTLLINKLRQFQELGHKVHFVVGDWTACIGDPTGQDKTRPILSRKQVRQQAETYVRQITQTNNLPVVSSISQRKDKFKNTIPLKDFMRSIPELIRQIVVKFEQTFTGSTRQIDSDQKNDKLDTLLKNLKRLGQNKNKIKICYNSKFYDRSMSHWTGRLKLFGEGKAKNSLTLWQFVEKVASHITVDQILQRDDFKKRRENKKPLYLQEFLYPIFQAYDSVALEADVELGGTDQLFNLLLARDLQEKFHQSPQCILTLPLLEGLDGVQKMSKSLNNYIAFNDSPKDIYGKVMSISDDLMHRYWEVLAGVKWPKERRNPKTEKELLAFGIVSGFHGERAAHQAKEEFQRVFSRREFPDQIPEKIRNPEKDVWVCHLIVEAGLCTSTSEARRHIQGGGIKIYFRNEKGEWGDGKKISDYQEKWNLKSGGDFRLSLGRRRFVEIKVR